MKIREVVVHSLLMAHSRVLMMRQAVCESTQIGCTVCCRASCCEGHKENGRREMHDELVGIGQSKLGV